MCKTFLASAPGKIAENGVLEKRILSLASRLMDFRTFSVKSGQQKSGSLIFFKLPHFMLASPGGFEPPTPALGERCSILLSYGDNYEILAYLRGFPHFSASMKTGSAV